MKTYPEMNEKIVGILRQHSDPVVGYAAARIEELERQLEAERQARREAEQRLVVDIEQNIDVVEGNLTGVKIDFL